MTIEESGLKARVICNPASGGGGYDPEKIRAELEDFEVEWIETEESGDASKAAKEWDNGLLIVAGGDGTINEVVNGLGQAGFPENVTLGLLPAGTGNDLAATLAIPADPDEAEKVLRQNRVRWLDVARVRSTGIGEKYFINVATGGLGAEIFDAADSEAKKRWGSSPTSGPLWKSPETTPRRKSSSPSTGRSIESAPSTSPSATAATRGRLARLAPSQPRRRTLGSRRGGGRRVDGSPRHRPHRPRGLGLSGEGGLFFARASKIRVESEPGSLEFTVDGEVIGDEPAEFTVIPKALKVIVGPEYVPEPEG